MFATTVVLSMLIHSLAVYWDIHPWNHMVGREAQLEFRDFENAAWYMEKPQILWQGRFALDLLDED